MNTEHDASREAIQPETSFELIEEWMERARDECKKQRRMDAARLWNDALDHLRYQQAALTHSAEVIKQKNMDAPTRKDGEDAGTTLTQPEAGVSTHVHEITRLRDENKLLREGFKLLRLNSSLSTHQILIVDETLAAADRIAGKHLKGAEW